MNSVSLMGRLTKDPELRYTTGNNTAVCSLTIAVDREYQQEGKEKEADFIPCIIWQKRGESAAKFLEKGRRIAVTGRIQTRNWDDNDGKKHYVTEVVVEKWYFADDKKKEGTGSAQGQPQQQNQSQTPPQTPPPSGQAQGNKPPWMQ